MKGNGSSSWPTATGTDANGARSFGLDGRAIRANAGPTLNDLAHNWTTPQAHDVTARGSGQKPSAKAGNACLATDAQNWTTPSASDQSRGGTGITEGMSGTSLVQQTAQWVTPRASDAEKGSPNQAFGAGGGQPLPAQAAQWPTPMAGTPAQNGNNAAGNNDFSRRAETLAAGIWPTPAARDMKGENSADHLTNGTGRLHMDQLPNAVAHGFSRPDLPTVTDGPTLSQLRPIWRPLRASLIASHGRATWRRLWASRSKRRLNPLFVEWLMGWPEGHALCASSATAWCHWQQHMRGALSQLPTASGPWIWKPMAMESAQAEQMNLFGAPDHA